MTISRPSNDEINNDKVGLRANNETTKTRNVSKSNVSSDFSYRSNHFSSRKPVQFGLLRNPNLLVNDICTIKPIRVREISQSKTLKKGCTIEKEIWDSCSAAIASREVVDKQIVNNELITFMYSLRAGYFDRSSLF